MRQSSRLLSLVFLLPLGSIGTSVANAGDLVPGQAISREFAVEIATHAVDICAARGYAVSASIADPAGNVRTMISADGVPAVSIEVARRKARTAALLRAPTSVTAKAVEAAPGYGAMLNSVYSELVFNGGGVPITAKFGLVGAIGIGGAPDGDKDEACALAALEMVARRLN